jgi:putative antireceptor protein|nr:MAG TPA: tail tape measure [Caudoviricetes sp.]
MADGKVVIQVEMDGNKAQSGVERLKSLMGGLAESGERAGSVFKSVLGANVISSALFSGIGALNGGIREMMSELNSSQKAWKTFEGNLQAFGRSANEIKKAKEEMQDFATKTIYSASDMASTYSQLDAVGTKNVGSLVKAFGGLAASAENPAQAMKSLSTQATQMASKPKIAWMDFKIMMEQAPAGMAAVAKEMGMSTADLVKAVQDGKVKTEDFFDALNRAGNSDAFQKMATEFKTVDQAIDGAKESLSNKLMPAFEQLNKFGIKAINAISDALEKINFDKIAEKLGAFLEGIDIDGIISTVTGAFANIGSIIGSVNTVIQDLVAGAQTAFEAFKNTGALDNAGQALKDLSEAALDLASKLANAIPWDTIGEAAGKIVNFVSQMASSFASFVKGLDPNTIRNVATALVTMAVALKGIKTGVAIAKSLKSAFDFGKNIVSLIGNILGLTAAQATNAAASTAMSAGTTAVGTSAGASASSVMKLGVAVLMVGAGILAAAAGIYVLVQAAIQLSSAGAGAQIALLAIVAGIALLAVGAAAIGPALTVGAVGILAFGAAIALIGAGVAVAALGIAVLVDAIANGFALIINTISSNAPQIISIIQAIAEGIRTGMDGVANIIISVGTAINTALQGIADIFKSVGESISTAAQGIGKGIESVFNGISTVISSVGGAVRTVLDGIANVFTSIGTAARNAGLGVKSMAEGIQILVGLNLADLAGTLTVVSAGLAAIASSGIATAGPGLQQAGTGLMLIATSAQLASLALQSVPTALSSLSTSLGTLPETLTSAGASMSAFASSVTASFASLSGSVSSIMMLQTGLMSLATAMMMAQSGASAMSSTLTMINASASSASASISQLASGIASVMTQAVSSVQSSMALIVSVITQSSVQMTQAGQQAGRGVSEGITNGIRSGVGSAMSAMATMVSSIQSTGMRGVSTMRYVGSMIGQGLASGMYSALGAVTAAANALVAQAERAAQAKAKIHSPSRLFRDNVGRYISQGVAVGILADAHKVDDAMGDVFDQIKAFNFAPEDIIGVGQTSLTKTLQVKSDLDRQIKASVKVVQEKSNRIVEQALEVAEKAVKRPVNMMMESGVLVGQIGQQMTEFQNDKLMIDNMMRGNY